MQNLPNRPDGSVRVRRSIVARLRAHLQSRSRGQSLVEFGLILPVFLLLFATTLDLGRLAFARVTVTNAAREGAFQASKTPTDFDPTQPCPAGATSNLIVCRVQLEAKSSGVTIAPSDIAVACATAGCPKQVPSRVTVTVTGHFVLLTPVLATFFNNSQNITFTSSATTQIEAFPPIPSAGIAGPSPTPTPTPTPGGSSSPTPTPTSATCLIPSAGFTIDSPTDLSNVHAPVTVTIRDASTSPNCGIDMWLLNWDTTQGQGTSSGPGVWTHTYAAKGDYSITLYVRNAAGDNTSGSVILHVKP
jgi:TadE-like protein/PKD domain-containing protein